MPRDEAAALSIQLLDIEPAAVKIDRQHFAAPCFRPLSALVNEQARVSMPASRRARDVRNAFAHVGPGFAGGPVDVVGGLFDDFIDARRGIIAIHPPVMRAGNDMP